MTHQAWLAFLRRDWRIARSYRFPFIAGVVSAILGITIYFYMSRIVRSHELPAGGGRSQGYFTYALIGIVMVQGLGITIYAVARRVREELMMGTFEVVAATPVPSWLLALGNASYEVIYGAASGIAFTALAIVVFGARFDVHPSSIPVLLVAVVALIALVGALGILTAAITIVVKRATVIAAFAVTAIGVVSGVYYPVRLLPEPLRIVSWASPFRWALDVLRPALFGGHVPAGELAGVIAMASIAVVVCFPIFDAALRHVRRTGSLVRY